MNKIEELASSTTQTRPVSPKPATNEINCRSRVTETAFWLTETKGKIKKGLATTSTAISTPNSESQIIKATNDQPYGNTR